VHANLADRPIIDRAATQLGVSTAEAIGLLVTLWGSVSQHAPGGLLKDVSDTQLERWAQWTRKRGKFAAFIRAHHLDGDGKIKEWDDYQGKLEQRRNKERERLRNKRDGVAQQPSNERNLLLPTRANEDETIRNDTSSSSPGPWQPIAETAVADRLPSNAGRNALTVVLRSAASRMTWAAEIGAMLDGMPGHIPATPIQVETALVEFVANGHAGGESSPSLKHFKAFVERAAQASALPRPPKTAPSGTGRATLVLGQIRALIQSTQQPGQAERRFIPKAKVAALGSDVLRAYEAIGGAERLLGATGEQLGFVARDFAAALEAAQGENRATA
jgi:hypothetical protein